MKVREEKDKFTKKTKLEFVSKKRDHSHDLKSNLKDY